jgi:hypothetical protein
MGHEAVIVVMSSRIVSAVVVAAGAKYLTIRTASHETGSSGPEKVYDEDEPPPLDGFTRRVNIKA